MQGPFRVTLLLDSYPLHPRQIVETASHLSPRRNTFTDNPLGQRPADMAGALSLPGTLVALCFFSSTAGLVRSMTFHGVCEA